MNAHICTVCGVDLVVAVVDLLHGQLGDVVGDVVRSPPCWRTRPVRLGRKEFGVRRMHDSSSLARVPATIVADAQELLVEALEVAGGNVPHLATQLACRAVAASSARGVSATAR